MKVDGRVMVASRHSQSPKVSAVQYLRWQACVRNSHCESLKLCFTLPNGLTTAPDIVTPWSPSLKPQ